MRITYYVAECMEFPNLGEYHETEDYKAAICLYNQIPSKRMNGIKGIGILIDDGEMVGEWGLLYQGKIDYDGLDLVPQYRDDPEVRKAVSCLEHSITQGLLM